jgi:hypothetical protein
LSSVTARRIAVTTLLALGLIPGAPAHRLDEYLQATLIGVSRDGADVEIQLTPGVAMLPLLMAVIDQDRDGRISPAEQRDYASRIVRDVELLVDGAPAPLSLIEATFPAIDAMREGLGTIRIKLRTARSGHVLRFENRHLPQFSVYLVNCLAAPSEGLVVGPQTRDQQQRSIQFEYAFVGNAAPPPRAARIALESFWPAALGMLLAGRMAVFIYRKRSRP